MIQSDNGEFKSNKVRQYLHSVGGSRRTVSAYTPELMARIERLRGTVQNMATAMLIEKGLPEPYWAFAQAYDIIIYNNIPQGHPVPGEPYLSPSQKFNGIQFDLSLLKIFGCRSYVSIPNELRRKNHARKATQCIFVGIDPSEYPGYLCYSPELNDLFSTGDVIFHETLRYDGRLDVSIGYEAAQRATELPERDLDDYKYLEGTNHIDPDDGLLYKIIEVRLQRYKEIGKLIVGIRAQVYPDGKVSTAKQREEFHIRDLEQYYEAYIEKLKALVHPKHIERARAQIEQSKTTEDDDPNPVRPPMPKRRLRHDPPPPRAKLPRRSHSNAHASTSTTRPADDPDVPTLEDVDEDEDEDLDIASVIHADTTLHYVVEQAMLGDPFALHALPTNLLSQPPTPEPNTHEQAMRSSEKKHWMKAEKDELQQIENFQVFSEPMLLPKGARALRQR